MYRDVNGINTDHGLVRNGMQKGIKPVDNL